MAKLLPLYYHCFYTDPPLLQNPLSHKPTPITSCSPTSLALSLTDSALETAPLQSYKPGLSSSGFCSLNETDESGSLDSVKSLHAQMIKIGKSWNSDSTAKILILYYLEFGDFKSAAKVFLVDFSLNYIEWSSFLEEYRSYGGKLEEILESFSELHNTGVVFDGRVLTIVLRNCTNVMDSWLGVEIHANLIKTGLDSDMYLKCALMNFYAKCWDVESANKVFDKTSIREDLLWNEAIMVNLKNENWGKAMELFREMQFSFVKAHTRTIVKMLQACGKLGALKEGKKIHGYVLKFSLESNLSISNSLISMYSKNDKLEMARKVFDSMEDHNLSSWNSIISGYTSLGNLNEAWDLFSRLNSYGVNPDIVTWNCLLSGHFVNGSYIDIFTNLHKMQSLGFRPNASSVTIVLQVVIELRILKYGKEIHGYVIRNGLDYDVYVGTSLIDMYLKNDCLENARSVFNSMKNRNIVAWNSLISGYSFKGLFEDAKNLLKQMEGEGIKPDLVTWNGLVSGYSIWDRSKEALATIDQMKNYGVRPNVVTWTSLISGSSRNENYRESLEYFIQMQKEGVKPNEATMSSLLRTFAGLGLLQKGKEVHCICTKNEFTNDPYVVTALVDMYTKSGNLKSAREVFEKSSNKTLASWNCMIMGLAIYGHGKAAISLFDEMWRECIRPDDITFTALLSACKNSGLVDEGWTYFDSMRTDYNITPSIEHYSCMVDLLGRASYLDEAWDFIQTMPINPDATIWGALLGSCGIHKNIEFAEIAAEKLFELEPYNSANYVLMMNMYAMSNRWEDVERVKDLMSDKGVKNRPVWSWVQINQSVHVFSTEGKPHPESGEIYFELYQLVSEMKKLGYSPYVSYVYQNIDESEKEKVLLSHTEKLAITYGLINTSGNPIRVIKNTRVCSDCHAAAKCISLLRNREIYLRDGVRFHHFKDGKCSCEDY